LNSKKFQKRFTKNFRRFSKIRKNNNPETFSPSSGSAGLLIGGIFLGIVLTALIFVVWRKWNRGHRMRGMNYSSLVSKTIFFTHDFWANFDYFLYQISAKNWKLWLEIGEIRLYSSSQELHTPHCINCNMYITYCSFACDFSKYEFYLGLAVD